MVKRLLLYINGSKKPDLTYLVQRVVQRRHPVLYAMYRVATAMCIAWVGVADPDKTIVGLAQRRRDDRGVLARIERARTVDQRTP